MRVKGRTYGTAWMYKTLIKVLKHVNIRVLYVLMAVCVIPVTMLVSNGARVTYRYFRERRGEKWWETLRDTYRNHCVFGQTVIDKFACYAGHQFKVKIHGLEQYRMLQSSPKALIQLNAHMGCSEILGYSLRVEKPCNVLVYGGEKQVLMAYRKALFRHTNMNMIPVASGTSHSEEILAALERGETICAFADRFVNHEKVVNTQLHGAEVTLARGPFSMAVTCGVDVVMASCMKEKDGSYTAFFTPLSYDKTLSKSEQRQQLACAYTAEIERVLERYPMQWFNYSWIWKDK